MSRFTILRNEGVEVHDVAEWVGGTLGHPSADRTGVAVSDQDDIAAGHQAVDGGGPRRCHGCLAATAARACMTHREGAGRGLVRSAPSQLWTIHSNNSARPVTATYGMLTVAGPGHNLRRVWGQG